MSAFEMLDMCVYYIAQRHHMLTDEHVEILNRVWDLYEPSLQAHEIPLPPSPPPEREHLFFEEEHLDTLWHQIPQPHLVSESMPHEEVCGCETCEWQDRQRVKEENCDADGCTYECGQACGASEPVELPETETIDLTCERPACTYGCICAEAKNLLAPPEGCLYGCNYACGTNYGENCTAIFDINGNQVMPDDDMPPLVPLAAYATPRGWFNPEEDSEDEGYAAPTVASQTEIVSSEPKPPKEKPLFPYNHPRWPSPRAKMMVRYILGPRARQVLNVKTLTHDICMRWLAKHYRLSHEELLKTSIYKLHNPERASWNGGHGTWESVPGKKSYWDLPPQCRCAYCKDERCYY
jgi:hypothetical protein